MEWKAVPCVRFTLRPSEDDNTLFLYEVEILITLSFNDSISLQVSSTYKYFSEGYIQHRRQTTQNMNDPRWSLPVHYIYPVPAKWKVECLELLCK